jgi:hypothetical protein
LPEQLTCSTAEGSIIHVSVHGKLPLLMLDLKKKLERVEKF